MRKYKAEGTELQCEEESKGKRWRLRKRNEDKGGEDQRNRKQEGMEDEGK